MISGGKHDNVRLLEEALESWSKWATVIMKEYKPEVVWNMDLTGCLWKGLPNTSFNKKGVQCRGEKNAKQCNPGHFLSMVNCLWQEGGPDHSWAIQKLKISL